MMIQVQGGVLDASPAFKAGDQPPSGYMDWHDWAHVQHKGGLRQKRCPRCFKWRFPQEKCCGEPLVEDVVVVNIKAPPCPKCGAVPTVIREGAKLIAVCSHCRISGELRAAGGEGD